MTNTDLHRPALTGLARHRRNQNSKHEILNPKQILNTKYSSSYLLTFSVYRIGQTRYSTGMAREKLTKYGWHIVVGTFAMPLVCAVFFFPFAGRLDVWQGWLYAAVNAAVWPVGTVLLWRANPDLLNQRGKWKKQAGTPVWDQVLLRAFSVFGFYLPIILAGLDVGRYRWCVLPAWVSAVGVVLFVIGGVILHWAMLVNRHFEATVRLQRDRDHRVVTGGPYRFVRHPGYVGALLWIVSIPLTLGSGVSLLPAAAGCVLLVVRTYFEDKMLRENLEGYADYAAKVRSRLLPGVW